MKLTVLVALLFVSFVERACVLHAGSVQVDAHGVRHLVVLPHPLVLVTVSEEHRPDTIPLPVEKVPFENASILVSQDAEGSLLFCMLRFFFVLFCILCLDSCGRVAE